MFVKTDFRLILNIPAVKLGFNTNNTTDGYLTEFTHSFTVNNNNMFNVSLVFSPVILATLDYTNPTFSFNNHRVNWIT